MLGTPKEVTLPNPKVYRAAWVLAFVVVVIALFTLGTPGTPKLSAEPVSFDGALAAADLRTIAEDFPGRVAGSDADNRAAIWLDGQFAQLGLETHVESFATTINGRSVALQNVWALAEGTTRGTILVVANRDVPPAATQGANDNASGTAVLLGLARAFTVTGHAHSIILLSTSGDASGALGARRFVKDHETDDLLAVIALRRVATRDPEGVGIDGWSATAKVAPPWLWLLTGPAARVASNQTALTPSVAAQVLRLGVPASAGSHAPFVAAGVPGITLTAEGRRIPVQADTVANASNDTLVRMGSAAQAMVMAVDAATTPGAASGGTIFLNRQRTLPGVSLAVILAALLIPLAAVTVDLLAHCMRARIPLQRAVVRAALHTAPWLVLIAIVYFANLVGLLPRSPDAVIPPDSALAGNPRYLRVVVLGALLIAAYAYAVAVERRIGRRFPADPRATIFISHAALLLIAVLLLLVNPYSVILAVPAAVLWPLARPGGWARSIVPVYVGLAAIPGVLVYYAAQLEIGWNVWWYFFLLFENRTIPVIAVLLGALFLATAGTLAHTLHERGIPAVALSWPAVERRGPDRLADAEWAARTEVELRRTHHGSRSRRRKRGPLKR